jgi:small subunit ribosomal protein S1
LSRFFLFAEETKIAFDYYLPCVYNAHALKSTGEQVHMMSNNPNLGPDMSADDTLPETEHTTPEVQSAAELSDMTASDETTTHDIVVSAADLLDAPPAVDESDAGEPDEPEEEVTESTARFRRGTIVDGIVAATSPTEVLVDLGEGLTGVIASRELERMDRSALESLKIGGSITAYVLKAKGSDGRPVLSLARAEEENNWRMAEEHHQNKQVYFSKVAGYNKGGLIVRFGKVRGFVPASQVSRERQQRAAGETPEERWSSMVGEDVAVKVVEIDRARNRLILSERAAAREWREQQKSRLLENLAVGEVRKGRVISIADFGAFVDLGGADGLVHLTELSWKHVTHPREILAVGQEVEVEVISIDPQRKRIGLSMKRMEHDPWQAVVRQYGIGQLVQATVTKLTKFGAFARLVDAPEIEGLIHISELADYRVSHPREVVLVGDVLTLRIVKIDADQRRLGLSLRQVDSQKYLDQDWQAVSDKLDTNPSAPEGEPPSAE